MYEKRFYRDYHRNENQLKFTVSVNESDLLIIMDPVDEVKVLSDIIKAKIVDVRKVILDYDYKNPGFIQSLKPLECNRAEDDAIICKMCEGAKVAGVGPMAAVAGVTAEEVVKELIGIYGDINIIAENGGDIYMNGRLDKYISIYAGKSPLSNELAIKLPHYLLPVSICTSSGTVGHSLSFGKGDAVVVLSMDSGVADACATALCNQIGDEGDIQKVIESGKHLNGVLGIVIIVKDKIGMWGEVDLVKNHSI